MKFDKLLHGGDYFPEQWLNYPGIIEEDIKLLKESKSNAVSIGMFAWTTYEPEEEVYNFDWLDEVMDKMAENGIQVMLATPSGARPDWMSKKYPEVLRTTARREQLLHGERHNHCLSSPYYRKKVKDINRKLANRYKNHPALSMWHVSNEYSGECHCDLCQAAFRNWLKNKYHNDLDELNHAWWTSFWSHKYTSWNQIESPSPIGEMHTHGLNLDWKRFITDQTLDFYRTEIDPLKKITPEIPVFTNFQADNSDFAPFTGLNYAKFVEDIDLVAWNAYPKWHNDTEETYETASKVALVNDYYKTLKQQPFILTESTPSKVNWHNVNKAKRPGMHILSSMQMIAHGSNSNLYFQVRKSRGSSEKFHGAIINHGPSEKDRVFQEVKKVGDIMHQISSEIIGSNRYADVGILYDVENSWALNDAQGYGMNTKDYAQTVSNHYQALWKKDIPVDLLSPKDDFDSYKLLILPMLYMMDQKMLDKIEKFVKEGGSIVLTYISGVVNQNDLVYMDGWPKELQRVFGLDVLEVDTLYPKDRNQVLYKDKYYEVFEYASIIEKKSAKSLGIYQEDFYASEAALTKNQYGEGMAYYIGARMEEQFQEDFYKSLIEENNLKSIINVDHDLGVSIQGRIKGDQKIVFIMNFTEKEQIICINEQTTDLLTGEQLTGNLSLEKYEVRIVRA